MAFIHYNCTQAQIIYVVQDLYCVIKLHPIMCLFWTAWYLIFFLIEKATLHIASNQIRYSRTKHVTSWCRIFLNNSENYTSHNMHMSTRTHDLNCAINFDLIMLLVFPTIILRNTLIIQHALVGNLVQFIYYCFSCLRTDLEDTGNTTLHVLVNHSNNYFCRKWLNLWI